MTSTGPDSPHDERDEGAPSGGSPWGEQAVESADDDRVDPPDSAEHREFDPRVGGPGFSWGGEGAGGTAVEDEVARGEFRERPSTPDATFDEEGAYWPAIGRRPYASFTRRAGGFVIDHLIKVLLLQIVVVVAGIDVPADPLGIPAYLSGLWLSLDFMYKWLFFRKGWTPGARILRMRIARLDGSAPGNWSALLRALGSLLSEAAFLIGYLWMLWDGKRQTWQDKMAGTYVVMAEDEDYAIAERDYSAKERR